MLRKPAETDFEIHHLIAERWSPRAFSDRPVEPEKLLTIFEAARWAPSSFNEQPWRFIVASKDMPNLYDRILSTLTDSNKRWAARAPVLMISVAKTFFDHNGKPNRHAYYDTGQAVAFLTLQAADHGLWLHQMAGFRVAEARELLDIPEGFDPVTAIALGYQDNLDTLPPELAEKERAPRSRRPLQSFVFQGKWGEPIGVILDK